MKEIIFHTDENGNSELYNYLRVLKLRNNKDSRLNDKKIYSYIEILSRKGVIMGEPYVKYNSYKIWELRPMRHRILFFENKDEFVLLNHFVKDTNRTPRKEIVKAIKNMKDYLRREK